MKLLKKATTGVLALVMSFSFFACDGETPGDSSPTTSTPPASSPTDSSGGEDVTITGEGEKYLEGVVNAIRAAQTITMDVAFTHDYSDKDLAHGTGNTYDDDYDSSIVEKFTFDATATFSKTADSYNAHIKMDYSAAYEYGEYPEDNETYSETVEMYLANGFLYGFNKDLDRWEKFNIDEYLEYANSQEVATNIAVVSYLEPILEFYNFLMTGDWSDFYKQFGPVFEQNIVVQNNAYNFDLNLVDDVKGAFDYLINLDYTQTLESYINAILAELGAETTVADILATIATYGDYTMGQAYDELSLLIQEQTGMTVNELKNKLIEEFDTEILEMYFPAEQLTEILATLEEIKAMDAAELIEPYKTMTVNDVIAMMYESGYNEEEVMPMDVMYEEAPTLEELIAEISQIVSMMTLEDVLASMEYSSELIKSVLSNITINKLGQRAVLRFNGYAISSVELATDVDLTEGIPNDFLAKVVMKMTEKLALSNETTTITPPADAVLIHPEDM